MTDGGCKKYPKISIKRFKSNIEFKNKIAFYSVGFGPGSDNSLMK